MNPGGQLQRRAKRTEEVMLEWLLEYLAAKGVLDEKKVIVVEHDLITSYTSRKSHTQT